MTSEEETRLFRSIAQWVVDSEPQIKEGDFCRGTDFVVYSGCSAEELSLYLLKWADEGYIFLYDGSMQMEVKSSLEQKLSLRIKGKMLLESLL